jgi:hypothetical protein
MTSTTMSTPNRESALSASVSPKNMTLSC